MFRSMSATAAQCGEDGSFLLRCLAAYNNWSAVRPASWTHRRKLEHAQIGPGGHPVPGWTLYRSHSELGF